MTHTAKKNVGRVVLVGAGPGDPGLITVAGLAALREADVVVYDALANPRLLDEVPAEAERIDVGKRAGNHRLAQEDMNQLLIDKAREGRLVVRLKGGDPYLFGRGAEEVTAVASAAKAAGEGITVEVIPGVTSGIAGPAMAGIPVTHRKIASTVTFVTGHEEPGKLESAVDYGALAKLISAGGTACFYMGVGRLDGIVAALVAGGLDMATPAAAVQWATMPKQKSVRAKLGGLSLAMSEAGIGSPAIVVVGQVVGLDEPGLDFFESRLLFGQVIVITRTRQQSSVLRSQLEALGAQVLEAPTIEIEPVDGEDEIILDRSLRSLASYDWLILTSANAVAGVASRLSRLHIDSRALGGVRIAVVGEATEQALYEHLRVNADFQPRRSTGLALSEQLAAEYGIAGKKFLLPRADIAGPELVRSLRGAGGIVDDPVLYHTRLAGRLPLEVLEALRGGGVDWMTFTSSSTARNMVTLLGEEKLLLERCKLASIGPITSGTLRELGLVVAVEATAAGVDGLVEAMVR